MSSSSSSSSSSFFVNAFDPEAPLTCTAAACRTTLTPACSLQTLVVESYTFHPAVTSSTTPASFCVPSEAM
jgi:hypothetical protein